MAPFIRGRQIGRIGGEHIFKLSGTTEIQRDAKTVAQFLADPVNDAKWQAGIVASTVVSGSPAKVGSKFEKVQLVMGRNVKSTLELETFEPSRIVFKGSGKIIEYRTLYALTPAAGQTRLEMRFEGELQGFAAMFESVAAEEIGKQIPQGLAKLKTVLES